MIKGVISTVIAKIMKTINPIDSFIGRAPRLFVLNVLGVTKVQGKNIDHTTDATPERAGSALG
ncbi:MAG: hypothetical protein ACREHG_04580 [Candidatus Saccharimonadales bacterium]